MSLLFGRYHPPTMHHTRRAHGTHHTATPTTLANTTTTTTTPGHGDPGRGADHGARCIRHQLGPGAAPASPPSSASAG